MSEINNKFYKRLLFHSTDDDRIAKSQVKIKTLY